MKLSHASRRRLTLTAFLAAATAVSFLPYIRMPLMWFETFFHEVSHGLAAILTGGSAKLIRLNFDGSGTMWTAGGWQFAVYSGGYAGAILWGCLVYIAASTASPRAAAWISGLLGAMAAVTMIGWASFVDFPTLAILAFITAAFGLLTWKAEGQWIRAALRFVGAYVLMSGLRSPLYILAANGQHNDAVALRKLTWLPEIVWVGLWIALGIAALWWLYRVESRGSTRSTTAVAIA